jgi:hypothetical protein
MFVFSVNSGGVQLVQSAQLMTGDEAFTLGNIHYSALAGYLYGQAGPIIDPSASTVIGHLPMGALGTNGPQQGDGVYIISGAFVTTPSVQLRVSPGLNQ